MLHTFMTSCLRKLARVSLAVSNFIDCFQSQNIKHRTTHTHTQPFNGLWSGQPG